MILLSVHMVLLSRLSGNKDIVTGIATAGRRHEKLKNIIGLFFNVLALRCCVDEELSFRDFLQIVKQHTLKAFENEEYAFDTLVADLVEQGTIIVNPGRHPLFETMFSLNNLELQAQDLPDIEIPELTRSPYRLEKTASKLPLLYNSTEVGNKIFLSLDYQTSLFKKSTVERIITHYQEILEQVTENEGLQLADITLSSDALKVKSTFPAVEYSGFEF